MKFFSENDIIQFSLSTGLVDTGRVFDFDNTWIELKPVNDPNKDSMFIRIDSIVAYRIINEDTLVKHQEHEEHEEIIKEKTIRARELIDKEEALRKAQAILKPHRDRNETPKMQDARQRALKEIKNHLLRIQDERADVAKHMKRKDLGGYAPVEYERPAFGYEMPGFTKRPDEED